MHITRLRLLGFKSFVEPAELVIERGLTGVVGPNGCGKSNLLEALRWVMGETSYKNMRASSMEDVIFSGTNKRPARNIAQVTITLDNRDRKAHPAFNDDDNLEITRRIERDSGSQYHINGKPVRARDVQLLFADASTGAHSPALVQQGRIGEIVSAKPAQSAALCWKKLPALPACTAAAMRLKSNCAGRKIIWNACKIYLARWKAACRPCAVRSVRSRAIATSQDRSKSLKSCIFISIFWPLRTQHERPRTSITRPLSSLARPPKPKAQPASCRLRPVRKTARFARA